MLSNVAYMAAAITRREKLLGREYKALADVQPGVYSDPGIRKPISQAAGDDYIGFANRRFHYWFNTILTALGCELPIDKNGGSEFYGNFCETAVCLPTGQGPENFDKSEVYHYIDTVKGRILNGISKISGGTGSPSFGHAMALSTTCRYLPASLARTAYVLFWANNPICRGLKGVNAPFPPCFGGFSLPKGGRPYQIGNNEFLDRQLEYIQSIYKFQSLEDFVYYSTLLSSINAPGRKGESYKLPPEYLRYALEGVEIKTFEQLGYDEKKESYTAFMRRQSTDGYTTLLYITQWITRLGSFRSFINGQYNKSYKVLDKAAIKSQHDLVWQQIHDEVPRTPLEFSDIAKFERRFCMRLNSFFISKDRVSQRIGSSTLSFRVDWVKEKPKNSSIHMIGDTYVNIDAPPQVHEA
jgi:hypothetical protein